MFKPNYRITPHFLSCSEKVSSTITQIRRSHVRLPILSQVQQEVMDKSVHASTAIEGNTLSLGQVSALNANQDITADFKEKQEVLNYAQALQWVIKHKTKKISEKKLLSLHKIITDILLPSKEKGRYKTKPNYILSGKKETIFTPPPPTRTKKLMAELIQWVNKTERSHPIIYSAIFHHQLVSIHPFTDGNGRIARASAQWVLFQKGFDPHQVISLDEYFLKNKQRYYNQIQHVRDMDYDFTTWLDYIVEGLVEVTQNILTRIQKLSIEATSNITLTPKQEELISVLNAYGPIGSADLCELLNVNRSRINQLVTPLINAKVITQKGKARATRYAKAR